VIGQETQGQPWERMTPVCQPRGRTPAARRELGVWASAIVLFAWASAARAQESIVNTVHNLSTSGPGGIRASGESQVCIFCHAPHHTRGATPLWNRELSSTHYQIYQSSTLNALPGQPTGASKLCLSCHDGTMALGNVLSRADQIRMSGGDYLPSGLTNLGTDLSDDHPVSFLYSGGLAAADRQLNPPSSLPEEARLDPSGQMQCTSCHDAHHNRFGKFLVMRREFGALCLACHRMDGWNVSAHQASGASVSGVTVGDWPFATVGENACQSCHRSHGAGGHERLLIFEAEEENCLGCHDGRVARHNLRAEIDKTSVHDPRRYQGRHDPAEATATGSAHVECADCHNPHAVTAVSGLTGYTAIGPTLLGTPGVTIAGARIEQAASEYEVCFRCHADGAVPVSRRIQRQAHTENLRLKFSPSNPSFHPVVLSSPSEDTPSLVPGLARGSLIRCTDCHNNDQGPRAGGSGSDGPHGSSHDFLLERNYTVLDDNVESEFEYAICYKCHQQSSILSDQSFAEHREHIVEERTPCSACHDPHGVSPTTGSGSGHTHLINFDATIVRPEAGSGRLQFRDLGRFAGSCTLICHGAAHLDWEYGIGR